MEPPEDSNYVKRVTGRLAIRRALSQPKKRTTPGLISSMITDLGYLNKTNTQSITYKFPLVRAEEDGEGKKRKAWPNKTSGKKLPYDEFNEFAKEFHKLLQGGINAGPADRSDPHGYLQTTPQEVVLTLRNYQLHAVNRVLKTIKDKLKGFYLALGMGLGKTVIIIVIIIILHTRASEFPLVRSPEATSGLLSGDLVEGSYLLVVPQDLIGHWEYHIKSDTTVGFNVIVYHQQQGSVERSPDMLAAADIVITTYETLREDYRQLHNAERSFADGRQASWLGHFPLLTVIWKIVFFDEAQKMANADTGNWKAANALHRGFTLPFSGTPIQNEYSEVLSMMQLMQVKPLDDAVFFKENFLIPPPNKISAYLQLSQDLNAAFVTAYRAHSMRLTRHHKFNNQDVIIDLHEGRHEDIWHKLTPAEKEPQMRLKEKDLDPTQLLRLMTEARIGAVHVKLIDAEYGELGEQEAEVTDVQARADPLTLVEPHIPTWKQKAADKVSRRRQRLMNSMSQGSWHSSRLNAVVAQIISHFKKVRKGKREGKIVVYSEFLRCLDALQVALEESGFKDQIGRFDGTVKKKQRKQTEDSFNNDTDNSMKILLVTIRSGGVGRAFTGAGQVIHLSPCWNPGLVDQATERTIRHPQKKNVRVSYYFAEESVEWHIFTIQRQKRSKAIGALDPDAEVDKFIRRVHGWTEQSTADMLRSARDKADEAAGSEARRQDEQIAKKIKTRHLE